MDCEAMDEARIGAWVDGELVGDDARAAAAHLDACAACAARADAVRALGDAVRRELPPLAAPDLLRARIRADVRGHASGGGRALPRRWLAVAASVLVVAGAASSAAWELGAAAARRGVLADELVAGHLRSLQPGHLMDVVSTDQHTVKPWFDGRIDFAPPVHDLAARGYPLAGGRVDYLAGRPVAALVYARRRHWINVFIWPAGSGPPGGGGFARRGYAAEWCGGAAMECWAVSDLADPELRQFVALLRASDAALQPAR